MRACVCVCFSVCVCVCARTRAYVCMRITFVLCNVRNPKFLTCVSVCNIFLRMSMFVTFVRNIKPLQGSSNDTRKYSASCKPYLY